MLSAEAPFPFVGSAAFLRPLAPGQGFMPVRILQARADGRFLVSLAGNSKDHPDITTRASGNRTVSLAELTETDLPVIPVKRRRKVRP